MRFTLPASLSIVAAGLLLVSLPALALVRPRHHSTHAVVRHASSHSHEAVHHSVAVSMSSERATEIQAALIKKGYLSGEPTGTWDSQSIAAMQKLQGDNGWQTRVTPDARALISLGLGPQKDSAQVASNSITAPGQ
jgi:peptidoglycan hydrolase-like protein with peptidoglycan-binding domain